MNGVSRAVLVVAVLLPTLSSAQEASKSARSGFDYNFAELSYDKHDVDLDRPGNIDGDGFTLSGSVKLSDEWHLYASDSSANLDFGINLDTWTLGLGYSHSLKPNIDLYGRVLYIDSAADLGATTSHDNGLGLQFRVRGRVNDKVEVEGGIQYIDVASSDTALQASVRYYFTRAFSAGVGVTFGGDADGLAINARYSF
jgi:hypothetical protein